MIIIKKCTKCGEIKDESEFYFGHTRNKYMAECKECRRAIDKNKREEKKKLLINGLRKCKKCGEIKSISLFSKHDSEGRYRIHCNDCLINKEELKKQEEKFKKCTKCKSEKPVEQFGKRYNSKNKTYKFNSWCKECINEDNKNRNKYRFTFEEMKERNRIYAEKNKYQEY